MSAARQRLELAFSPEVVVAIEALVDERAEELVEERLAERRSVEDWLPVEEMARREGCSPEAVRMRARRGWYERRDSPGDRVYLRHWSSGRKAGGQVK